MHTLLRSSLSRLETTISSARSDLDVVSDTYKTKLAAVKVEVQRARRIAYSRDNIEGAALAVFACAFQRVLVRV